MGKSYRLGGGGGTTLQTGKLPLWTLAPIGNPVIPTAGQRLTTGRALAPLGAVQTPFRRAVQTRRSDAPFRRAVQTLSLALPSSTLP